MRSPRILVPFALVATVTAGIWRVLSAGETAPQPVREAPGSLHATSGSLADLERELGALRAELEALRRQQTLLSKAVDSVGGLATEAARKAEVASPTPAERDAAMAEREAARQARVEEIYGQLEEASYSEERDSIWAGRTEALIGEAVRAAGVGSQLTRAECRSNLCRIELVHAEAEAQTRMVEGLLSAPGLTGEFVVRSIREGERLVSRVYVAREGTRLPPFRK